MSQVFIALVSMSHCDLTNRETVAQLYQIRVIQNQFWKSIRHFPLLSLFETNFEPMKYFLYNNQVGQNMNFS